MLNFPAVAKKTYDTLISQALFGNITHFILDHLKKIKSPSERARFVHNVVDEYNREVFAHPLVQKLVPCQKGCAGCCHTQVSVTEDEAELLACRIQEGAKIDYAHLQNQMAKLNNEDSFYQLSYQDRKCVFLGSDNQCSVYEDRPSVCRTNAVLGDASQCSTVNGLDKNQTLRLIKTEKADMAIIGSFLHAKESGSLSHMLGKILIKNQMFHQGDLQADKKPSERRVSTKKKSVFKDFEL